MRSMRGVDLSLKTIPLFGKLAISFDRHKRRAPAPIAKERRARTRDRTVGERSVGCRADRRQAARASQPSRANGPCGVPSATG